MYNGIQRYMRYNSIHLQIQDRTVPRRIQSLLPCRRKSFRSPLNPTVIVFVNDSIHFVNLSNESTWVSEILDFTVSFMTFVVIYTWCATRRACHPPNTIKNISLDVFSNGMLTCTDGSGLLLFFASRMFLLTFSGSMASTISYTNYNCVHDKIANNSNYNSYVLSTTRKVTFD